MAWARVQGTATSSGANPSSLGITHPGADTVNNRLILGISYNGNNGTFPTISTVADTTNTYTADRSALGGNNAGYFTRGALYSANVVSSTTPTVTVTLSAALTGGDTIQLTIEEYSGLSTASNAVDVSTNSAGTLGVATSGATANTTAANELAVALYADDGGNNTPSAAAGPTAFTTRQSQVVNTTGQVVFSDADSGSSGSAITATYTPVGTGSNVIDVVVYKLAAGVATQSATYLPADIPNKNVGPMVQRFLFRQPPWPYAPDVAPLTNTEFATRVILPNRFVGPPVLRLTFRQPVVFQSDLAPVTNQEFATRVVLPNWWVGPPVLRVFFRQPVINQPDLAPVTNAEFATRVQIPNPHVGPPVLRTLLRQANLLYLNVTVGSDVTIALTGVTTTGAVGDLTPSTTVAITGITATGAVGTVVPDTNVTVSGVGATGSVGNLTPSRSVPVTGIGATGTPGTVAPGTTTGIAGLAATGSVGSVTPSTTLVVIGLSASGSVGTLTASGGTVATTDYVEITPPSGSFATQSIASGSTFIEDHSSPSTGYIEITPPSGGPFS